MVNLLTQPKCRTLAREAGFPTAVDPLIGVGPDRVISAIAMIEGATEAAMNAAKRDGIAYSDFDAVGDQNLITDYWWYSFSGLQIRSVRGEKGTGKYRDQLRLPVPSFAFSSALQIWKDCRAARRVDPKVPNSGFEPWSTFMSGQHKAYLQDVFPPPPGMYVVQAGDYLSLIASRQKMGTWQDWARVNTLHDPDKIYIGQKLIKLWTEYQVRSGDTMSRIFELYAEGITYARFLSFNAAAVPDPDLVAVKQIIRIPHERL